MSLTFLDLPQPGGPLMKRPLVPSVSFRWSMSLSKLYILMLLVIWAYYNMWCSLPSSWMTSARRSPVRSRFPRILFLCVWALIESSSDIPYAAGSVSSLARYFSQAYLSFTDWTLGYDPWYLRSLCSPRALYCFYRWQYACRWGVPSSCVSRETTIWSTPRALSWVLRCSSISCLSALHLGYVSASCFAWNFFGVLPYLNIAGTVVFLSVAGSGYSYSTLSTLVWLTDIYSLFKVTDIVTDVWRLPCNINYNYGNRQALKSYTC